MFEQFWALLMKLGKDVIAKAKKAKINQPAQALIIIWELADLVVTSVEKVSQEMGGLSGEQKKELAVGGLQKLRTELGWDGLVADEALGLVVDMTVKVFNDKHGSAWLGKVWRTIKPISSLLVTLVSFLPLVKGKKKKS